MKKTIERFEPKIEAKIITKLDKIFNKDSEISEDQAVKKPFFAIMDSANVVMCIAKTERAKRVLCRFGNLQPKDVPMDYLPKKNDPENVSKYSMDYMFRIIAVFNALEIESMKFSLKADYPLSIQNDDFTFILAPRVDNE